MAKLYFRYGAMNSGKSTLLMQVAHNYEERGMTVLVLKPAVDAKGGDAIVSRLGVRRQADGIIGKSDDVRDMVHRETKEKAIACLLIDEAQFLTPTQVDQVYALVIDDDLPCICYGLRTDFRGRGFPGANRLLQLAHSLEELKTICRCGRKAVLNLRLVNGKATFEGDQVAIDGKDQVDYESVCGHCYFEERRKAGLPPLDSLT